MVGTQHFFFFKAPSANTELSEDDLLGCIQTGVAWVQQEACTYVCVWGGGGGRVDAARLSARLSGLSGLSGLSVSADLVATPGWYGGWRVAAGHSSIMQVMGTRMQNVDMFRRIWQTGEKKVCLVGLRDAHFHARTRTLPRTHTHTHARTHAQLIQKAMEQLVDLDDSAALSDVLVWLSFWRCARRHSSCTHCPARRSCHTYTLSLAHSLTHTLSHSHTHTLSLSHTHTHSLSLSVSPPSFLPSFISFSPLFYVL